MSQESQGKRVAVLIDNGFEHSEMTEPRKALDDAGAQTILVSPSEGEVKGWKDKDWGESFHVDQSITSADPESFNALLLPGGVLNPDKLRINSDAMRFVKSFVNSGKPIGAICHGPWSLVAGRAVSDRTLTSWPSLKTDIQNAGGNWVDEEVVVDNGVVTSRNPGDIPAFSAKLIEEISEGKHTPEHAMAA